MLKSRRPRAGCERSAAAEATRLTGYPPPVGPDVAVAVIASESVEPEVQRFLGHLRSRNIRAAFYDVGPGVVMLLDTPVAEIESIIGGNPVIERVFIADTRYCLARREVWPTGTIVPVGGVPVGSGEFVLVAGPCAVESRSQLMETAAAVADAGASILRGGAFKPRTSPHNFQGLGLYGVDLLAEARAVYGLPFITEVMESSCIEPMYGLVDGFQVGARNMQNFELLKALGEIDRPVLLKRGPGATMEEWLLAAEYVLAGGNTQVILCERGIRTFNTHTRYTLDLATVAFAKRETHLPVMADPSHATGDPALVVPMALAALAAGADGVIVEVHPEPASALSDGFQAIAPAELTPLVDQLRAVASALGRSVHASQPPSQGQSGA